MLIQSKKPFVLSLFIVAFFVSIPQAMERFDIVTTEQLHALLQQRKAGKNDFLLINTLDKLIADYHSIPGSINIPWSDASTSSLLNTTPKNLPIITYCMGYR